MPRFRLGIPTLALIAVSAISLPAVADDVSFGGEESA